MIKALIKIRFKQLFRGIIGIGLIRIIFLIGLLGFVAIIMFIQLSINPNVYYITVVYLLIITLIHIRRQDKVFLKSHFANYKLIYLAEYFLLILPIILCLAYYFQWFSAVLVLFGIGIIINLDFKFIQRSLNTKIQQFIPHDCFEWKAGIRKTLFLILAIWIISLGTSFFIGSVPIAIFIFGIIPINFYEKNEPYQMILAYEMNTNKFLLYKIKLQITLFSILTIPLIVGFMIFHFEMWYIPVVEYFIFLSLHVYFILTKYAFYEPNSKSAATQLFEAFGVLGIITPILIPIIWLLSIWFYFKSHENLNFYLNDYN